jgi:GTP cyclohydrolase III
MHLSSNQELAKMRELIKITLGEGSIAAGRTPEEAVENAQAAENQQNANLARATSLEPRRTRSNKFDRLTVTQSGEMNGHQLRQYRPFQA